jgi:XTP/dITP diphosphohydrolase
MRATQNVLLASTNVDKYIELRELFKPFPDIKLTPVQEIIRNAQKLGAVEIYDTYLANATAKARTGNLASHYPCLADDSGLEVEALDGRPGVKSHRYAIPKSGQSQDAANIEKLLQELKGVPSEKRKARFVCALALVMEGILITATGTLEGKIVESPRGNNGFGFDPVFVPNASNLTLAEMSEDRNNAISHRSRAVESLMQAVHAKGIVFARP